MNENKTVIDNFETMIANGVNYFETIELNNKVYKPFMEEDFLFIPTLIYEPHYSNVGKYEVRLSHIDKQVVYQRISVYMIDKLVIKDGD